jgi:hypothetical protein
VYANKSNQTILLICGLLTIYIYIKPYCLHLIFGLAFTPQTPLLVISTTDEILLNMGLKCWNSTFNAQGSRLIIIIVHVKAVRIYVTIVEMLTKKEKHDEIQFTTKIDGCLSFTPPWLLMYFFIDFFNLTAFMTKLKVLVLCFPYFIDISNIKTKLQHLFTLLQFK